MIHVKCLEQHLECSRCSTEVTVINLAIMHPRCYLLTTLTWHPTQQVLLLTLKASGIFAGLFLCSNFLTLLEQPTSQSAGGITEPVAHLIADHRILLGVCLGCCLQCRPQCLKSSILFLNFASDPWGRPEASGPALLSLAIVQVGLESSRPWGFCMKLWVTANCN